MRKLLLLVMLGGATALSSQSQLQGIINSYAAVLQIDTCANALQLSSASDFLPGDAVLIIQMQGATINTANNGSFGDITNLGAAGLYEKGIIQAVNGNTLVLANDLLNTYAVSGKVQVVSLPVYDQATVSATLMPAAWNGQTGGVLAFEVTGTLSLNANIDLSGKGFRGGLAAINDNNDCSWLLNVNNFAYPLNDWRGAAKGEGIAIWTPGAEAGRGAQANGGGGGNDHNAGGGGGANAGTGGQGGNNDEPATFGCDGFNPGRGGKALNAQASRLFLGGGGGAGHENNNFGTSGAAGGGIGIIIAGAIAGNGFAIKSNGDSATDALSDGAGGGGAGGTLLLHAAQWTGPLSIEARGGNGGQVDNANVDRCQGPGGGGSGGRVRHNLTGLSPNVAGGTAGLTLHSSSCPDGPNGAQAGTAGLVENLVNFNGLPQGQAQNTPPTFLQILPDTAICAGQSIVFSMPVSGFNLSFQWQINTGTGFVNVPNAAPFSGAQTPQLTIANVPSNFHQYEFRLQVGSPCFQSALSEPFVLAVNQVPTVAFSYVATGLSVAFMQESSGAAQYLWDFGDGTQSQEPHPTHVYAQGGTYEVQLTLINDCGMVSSSQTISLANLPIAEFSSNKREGCTPLLVAFENLSTGDYTQLNWFFEGGIPATSSAENPEVLYEQAGLYQVMLVLSGPAGNDTLQQIAFIEALPRPEVSFGYSAQGNQVFFMNTSIQADTYFWNFGDGQTSTDANPVHIYEGQGPYEVTLNAQNDFCANAAGATIFLEATAVQEADWLRHLRCFPNPFDQEFFIELDFTNTAGPLELEIWSNSGILIHKQIINHSRTRVNTQRWASGSYWLYLKDGKDKTRFYKLIKS